VAGPVELLISSRLSFVSYEGQMVDWSRKLKPRTDKRTTSKYLSTWVVFMSWWARVDRPRSRTKDRWSLRTIDGSVAHHTTTTVVATWWPQQPQQTLFKKTAENNMMLCWDELKTEVVGLFWQFHES
jgi:hypothetical protein